MTNDPYALASTVIAALVAGVIVGAILVGIAARGNQLDQTDQASRAFKDLLAVAERSAAPEHRATLLREAAQIWDVFEPIARHASAAYVLPDRAPGYVHRIVDAYATGDPLNFSGCWVPPDVQGRVRAIMAGASEATTSLPDLVRGGPVGGGLITSVGPMETIEIWPARAGGGDG